MDISQLAELYGLPGLIIGGLAWAYIAERSERRESLKDRIAREREHSKELAETVRTLDAFKALIKGLQK